MIKHIEVCIDNLESLSLAIDGGATRIELCSALSVGGLTPSVGFMNCAAKASSVPVHAMIRPRQGDFLYSQAEIELMVEDIRAAAHAKLQGVVFGVLTQDGTIDKDANGHLIALAHRLGLSVTFHRAIDQCRDPIEALDWLIEQQCERVLTSGLASSAINGVETLAQMVNFAQGRIQIMAGAGVNPSNVATLVERSGVQEVHLSGKGERPSAMGYISATSKMGSEAVDDFIIPLTNPNVIAATIEALRVK
ncbi:copper homeostasis protein CutC [Vibrio sp. SM6]|uniref:PF03932 family protein CutC n=1 Tax=Vibrio agarilyticus TaxID=2726741 RepID=A0A7X8YI55_9VIBR|nr:copper homeostasis protein CutC [Vibrio agarilyticus]NLS14260.1 copper homeostasis protein CutC [Vibrio agarilyticus]